MDMHSGLESNVEEIVIRNSPTLNRDAVYTKISKIDRLPAYTSIQMVRFVFSKRIGKALKSVRDVKFPLSFDIFNLCSKQLQEKLIPMRRKFKELEDMEAEQRLAKKDKDKSEIKERKKTDVPYSFQDDIGSNNSGFYELKAVLTHQGRTSDSGHYVAWVKQKDIWIKFDDNQVTPVTSEEILKLSGGGSNKHCSYVLLFAPRVLQLPEGQALDPVFYSTSIPQQQDNRRKRRERIGITSPHN